MRMEARTRVSDGTAEALSGIPGDWSDMENAGTLAEGVCNKQSLEYFDQRRPQAQL